MTLPALVTIPILCGVTTQLIKFTIQAIKGELRWASLQEYGGMPSAHTAFVVSLSTVVGLHEGISSAAFAVSVIFALLIIRDAIGLRQYLSQHSKILNMLIKDLPDDIEEKYPHRLAERLGHTPWQATVGGTIGFVMAYGLYRIWP
jgi:acid phosphatase family membrane protein YuiD